MKSFINCAMNPQLVQKAGCYHTKNLNKIDCNSDITVLEDSHDCVHHPKLVCKCCSAIKAAIDLLGAEISATPVIWTSVLQCCQSCYRTT